MTRRSLVIIFGAAALTAGAAMLTQAKQLGGPANCSALPTEGELHTLLAAAPAQGGSAGGLFNGTRMWGAVVNRDGELCAAATSTVDPTQVWPGSQAIAKAKAYT